MKQPTPLSICQEIGRMAARVNVRKDSWSTANELEYLAIMVAGLDNTIMGQAACDQAFRDAYQKERALYPVSTQEPE